MSAGTARLNGNDSKPRACVDCEHHTFTRAIKKDDYRYVHYCERPGLRDLVTGQRTLCEQNRLNEKKCGWGAKYFTVRTSPAPEDVCE